MRVGDTVLRKFEKVGKVLVLIGVVAWLLAYGVVSCVSGDGVLDCVRAHGAEHCYVEVTK